MSLYPTDLSSSNNVTVVPAKGFLLSSYLLDPPAGSQTVMASCAPLGQSDMSQGILSHSFHLLLPLKALYRVDLLTPSGLLSDHSWAVTI